MSRRRLKNREEQGVRVLFAQGQGDEVAQGGGDAEVFGLPVEDRAEAAGTEGEAQAQAGVAHHHQQALAQQGLELVAGEHPVEGQVERRDQAQGGRQLGQAPDQGGEAGGQGEGG